MTDIASPELLRLLERVFDENADGDETDTAELSQRRFDFVFHMTDWLADLRRLNEIVSSPGPEDAAALSSELFGILIHVIPHLRAAFRAWQGFEATDPFVEPATHPAGTNESHPQQVT